MKGLALTMIGTGSRVPTQSSHSEGQLELGEAKRRKSSPPTPMEVARRWTNRVLDAYPRPLRPYVRLSLQLFAAMLILFAGLLIVAALVSLVEWLLGPPSVLLD